MGPVSTLFARLFFPVVLALAAAGPAEAQSRSPLASWQEGAARQAIEAFVAKAVDPASDGFIAQADRVAVFDNDGTLWSEQPAYFQLYFVMDRAKALAAADPGWANSALRRAAAAGDLAGVLGGGQEGLVDLLGAAQSGMPVEAFVAMVRDWLVTARHPASGRRFVDMTFTPMVELLDYLRAHGFSVYIVSGGGVDFIRAFAQAAYGVPPENVVGSMGDLRFGEIGGRPEVIKEAGIAFVDDGAGKPVGIARHIGRRPVFVGGNSDGDYEMAQWAMAGPGPRLALFVHHTDAAREWAYDRESAVGRLDKVLGKAGSPGWLFVDMKRDWKRVWPDLADARGQNAGLSR